MCGPTQNHNVIFPVFICGLILFLSSTLLTSAAQGELRSGDHVAILGDTITQQCLYSAFIEDYLLMCQPQSRLQATQLGWSSETAEALLKRMDNDVLPFKPAVATLCYGMSDGGYKAFDSKTGDLYRKSMTEVIQRLKKAGVRFIVVGSPGAVDPATYRAGAGKAVEYNKTLGELAKIARNVAIEQHVAFADLHTLMLQVMVGMKRQYGDKYSLGGRDGINPDRNGHLVMAYAFLKAMGCDGDLGKITLDLRTHKGTAAGGHKVLSFKGDLAEIESTRYPFCFYGKPSATSSTAGVLQFVPFNKELNRLTLTVTGIKGIRAKVSWDKYTKTFTDAELAKGINLAEEFPTNPFSVPFNKVQSQIISRQREETTLVHDLLHNLPLYKQFAPKEAAAFDRVAKDLIQKDAELRKESAAAVVPVKHTLRIQAIK